MKSFWRFYKRENMISKTLNIDENFYCELERLSDTVYDASISKLVNASIEELLNTEKIEIYKRERTNQVTRSFLIRESLLDGLYELKRKYMISINLLVNIAIRNAILEEKMDEEEQNKTNASGN
ncbi:MAG: hypothetical protein ACI4VQ_01000 [Clostridia bacterium]